MIWEAFHFFNAILQKNSLGKPRLVCPRIHRRCLITTTLRSNHYRFTSRTIIDRTHPDTRVSVTQNGYLCHVFVREDNLGGVVIADDEYPQRVAHGFLTNILEQFSKTVPTEMLLIDAEYANKFILLPTYLAQYQDPREADAITKIQSDLDDTKIILKNTIESVLQRGERLDDLVRKSEQLSFTSKSFYTTARKTNSCCNFGWWNCGWHKGIAQSKIVLFRKRFNLDLSALWNYLRRLNSNTYLLCHAKISFKEYPKLSFEKTCILLADCSP